MNKTYRVTTHEIDNNGGLLVDNVEDLTTDEARARYNTLPATVGSVLTRVTFPTSYSKML